MDMDRLKFVEQQVLVMQREISEVLQEMQVTIQGLTVTYGTALKVLDARLKELEKNTDKSSETTIREDNNGKEL